MTHPAPRTAALLAALVLTLTTAPACTATRATSPAPFPEFLFVDPDGRHLHQRVNCPGTLSAQETQTTVVLRYTRMNLPPGAGSCAIDDLTVTLATPLGTRRLLDQDSDAVIPVFDLARLPTPNPAVATALSPPGPLSWNSRVPIARTTYRLTATNTRFTLDVADQDIPLLTGHWQPQPPTQVNGIPAQTATSLDAPADTVVQWATHGLRMAVRPFAGTTLTIALLTEIADTIHVPS